MNPSCKLPCYMNSSNSKMLQIPLKQQLPAPKCYKHVAKSMENEMVQLQNAAKTFEMAASSSKMLQLARKTCRKKGSKKNYTETEKNTIPKTIPDPFVLPKPQVSTCPMCQSQENLRNETSTVLKGGLLSVPFALICIAVLLSKLGCFREAIEPLFHSSKAGQWLVFLRENRG